MPDAILDDRPQSDGLETIGGGDHRERPTGGCLADQHYQSSLPRTQRFAVGESFDEWPMPEVNSEPLDFRGASMFVHSCPEADGSNLEVLGFLPPKPHRTQRVPSMDQEQLIRRLSLPRFLFRAGARALGGPGPYAPGLATSLFQDSVEAFLRILAETGGVDLKSQVSFDGLVDKVSKSYPSVSGHKAALFRLNKIRVAFKHYGTSISGEDALHFREGAQAFLRETTRDALGLDFERASLVSVIGHRRTENRLLEAQEAVEAGRLREALECAAVALQIYLNARSVHRARVTSHRLWGLPRLDYRSADRRLQKSLTELTKWTVSHFEELHKSMDLLRYGIDLMAYWRFLDIAPNVQISMTGVRSTSWFRSTDTLTQEEAEFSIEFVVDSALRIGASDIHEEIWRDLKRIGQVEAEQDSRVMVYPRDDSEVIRSVSAGEVLTAVSELHGAETADYVAILQDGEAAFIRRDHVRMLSE